MGLLDKIYNRDKLTSNEIKAVKKYFTALDFIMIEEDYRTLPRKILTSYGILDLVNDYNIETERFSNLTKTVAMSINDLYDFSFFLSKKSYHKYKDVVVAYLLTHKKILIEYLNKKYNLKLEEKDLSRKYILKTATVKYSNKKVNNLRNYMIEKNKKYIKTERTTLMINGLKIYKLEMNKNDNGRYVNTRKLGRNAQLHKNETAYGFAATC